MLEQRARSLDTVPSESSILCVDMGELPTTKTVIYLFINSLVGLYKLSRIFLFLGNNVDGHNC
jgi:hypothetical protein